MRTFYAGPKVILLRGHFAATNIEKLWNEDEDNLKNYADLKGC